MLTFLLLFLYAMRTDGWVYRRLTQSYTPPAARQQLAEEQRRERLEETGAHRDERVGVGARPVALAARAAAEQLHGHVLLVVHRAGTQRVLGPARRRAPRGQAHPRPRTEGTLGVTTR